MTNSSLDQQSIKTLCPALTNGTWHTCKSKMERPSAEKKKWLAVQWEAGSAPSVSECWWHWGWYKPTQLSIVELIAGFKNVLMLHALSLFRQKPSCDRKMHNLIPYRPCLWSDAQGSALPRAGPVRSLLLVPPAQQDEGGTNKPTSPGSCGHCQGRGKVREAKRWIFEEFQARNQTGKNQSFCLHVLGSDRKLAQNSLHVQNKRENLKKPTSNHKKQTAKTQRDPA